MFVAVRKYLDSPDSQVLVEGVWLPDWDRIPGLELLQYVDQHTDTVFNSLQRERLLADLELWRAFEGEHGGKPESVDKIDTLIDFASSVFRWGGRYLIFFGR